MVATVGRRGRFQVAEPVFERGTPLRLDGHRAREGALALVGSGGKRGARVIRELGRPDVARDVLEGLMLDRGLRRAFPRRARGGGRRPAGRERRPRGPARPAHLHHRPARRARLRRRDLRAARGRPGAPVGAHRRRHRLRAAGHRGGQGGDAPGHQRVRAGGGRADAARGAVQRRLLAAAGGGQAGGDRGARDPRNRRALPALHALDRAQRRSPDLPVRRRGVRGDRARRGALGRAAGRRARGVRGPAGQARRPWLAGGQLGRAAVQLRPGGPRDRGELRGADRVAPPDRGADGAGQRAGGGPPVRLAHARRCTGSTSAPSRSRWSSCSSSSRRSTCPLRRRPSA